MREREGGRERNMGEKNIRERRTRDREKGGER
jgi:hypothetical protein